MILKSFTETNLSILVHCLSLSETNGANGRVGEDDTGDVRVVQAQVRLPVEQAVGEPSAGGDGHGGEQGLASHVPQGEDAGHIGVLERIHHHVAPGVQLHSNLLAAEVISGRVPSNSPEHHIYRVQLDPIGGGCHQALLSLLKVGGVPAPDQGDPA